MTDVFATTLATIVANLRKKAESRVLAHCTGDAAILTWVADAADDARAQLLDAALRQHAAPIPTRPHRRAPYRARSLHSACL